MGTALDVSVAGVWLVGASPASDADPDTDIDTDTDTDGTWEAGTSAAAAIEAGVVARAVLPSERASDPDPDPDPEPELTQVSWPVDASPEGPGGARLLRPARLVTGEDTPCPPSLLPFSSFSPAAPAAPAVPVVSMASRSLRRRFPPRPEDPGLLLPMLLLLLLLLLLLPLMLPGLLLSPLGVLGALTVALTVAVGGGGSCLAATFLELAGEPTGGPMGESVDVGFDG